MVLGAGLAACTADERPEPDGGRAPVRVSVAAGPMQGADLTTRAATQLGPEMENTIKWLDIFQFDAEGQHRKEMDYHYKLFQNDNDAPDGVLVADIGDIRFQMLDKTTIVFVANVDRELVDRFYARCAEESGASLGSITLEQFKRWSVQLPYDKNYKTDYGPDELNEEQIARQGLLTAVYMCGYYEGALRADRTLYVSLGRIPALLDITFNIEDNITKSIGCHLTNINNVSYIFPHAVEYSPERNERFPIHHPKEEGKDIVIEAGTVFHNYFYIGGHTTENEDEASRLQIYYGSAYDNFHNDGAPGDKEDRPSASLIISNQGTNADNRWELNRNTIYRLTINVHVGPVPPGTRSGAAGSGTVSRTAPDGGQIVDLYLGDGER